MRVAGLGTLNVCATILHHKHIVNRNILGSDSATHDRIFRITLMIPVLELIISLFNKP